MSKKISSTIHRVARRSIVTPHTAGWSRREFLAGMAAAGAFAMGGCGEGSLEGGGIDYEIQQLPDPTKSGIEHIVLVMMENRSFDHYLGWLPGADGMQAGLEYIDKQGEPQSTFRLTDFQNCKLRDPDHSYRGGRVQLNNGAVDGWLQARTDDLFPIGYYEQTDLDFFGGAIPEWTTFDRYFCAILAQTFPNRIYQHAGQTDRLNNAVVPFVSIPTIWDRLAEKGLTGAYYYSDLPVTLLWGTERYSSITKPIEKFFDDAAAGRLANVTYLDPRFVGEGEGITNDDHPFADIRAGQQFLNQIYEAVVTSPNWENTVFLINYDEWGGFFDHVAPPVAPQTELDVMIGNDGSLGFRVPCLLASPLARRGYVAHHDYDHTSILKMIEWRWGLTPLTIRDATANNIADALDFSRAKNFAAPRFQVSEGPFGGPCSEQLLAARSDFAALRPMVKAARL